MLDPAGPRKDLVELALCPSDDSALVIDDPARELVVPWSRARMNVIVAAMG
jgi:hypothetical protein